MQEKYRTANHFQPVLTAFRHNHAKVRCEGSIRQSTPVHSRCKYTTFFPTPQKFSGKIQYVKERFISN
jgi:hypothetical protein